MKGKVNPWAEKAFKKLEQRRKEVKGIPAVVEVEPGKADEVASQLRRLGYEVEGIVNNFVFVDLPEPADFEKVSRLPYVKIVSTQKRLWPMALGIDEIFKRVAVAEDPVLSQLKRTDLKELGIEIRPTAIMPRPFQAILQNIDEIRGLISDPTKLALRLLTSAPLSFPFPPVLTREDWKLVTDTRTLMDLPSIAESTISEKTKCAVVDSGLAVHPAMAKTYEYYNLTVDITPFDNMGHGQHVTTTAFGTPTFFCRYGWYEPVADAKNLLHVKVFAAFGPCTSFQIMKAMEICAKTGAKVVNMSLGGALQGSVEEDPECRLLEDLHRRYGTIWVVAAGNSGPEEWTISSPGASPYALTIAAIDWHNLEVAEFSSRGPQGIYYKENRDIFEDHKYKYGDNLIKPDCSGIGVRVVAGCVGWYDLLGVYDFIGDGYEQMSGTSQSTPHCSGLVALAIDRDLIKNVDDVKLKLKEVYGEKNVDKGYGLLKFSFFR